MVVVSVRGCIIVGAFICSAMVVVIVRDMATAIVRYIMMARGIAHDCVCDVGIAYVRGIVVRAVVIVGVVAGRVIAVAMVSVMAIVLVSVIAIMSVRVMACALGLATVGVMVAASVVAMCMVSRSVVVWYGCLCVLMLMWLFAGVVLIVFVLL